MSKAAAHTPGPANLGDLPQWDLSDLYPGPESPALESDFAQAESKAKAFEAAYKGKLASLTGIQFGRALAEFESIDESLARIGSYAQLLFSVDMDSPETARFYQGVHERVTDITTHTLFFELELNRLDESLVDSFLADPAAARYAPWVRDARLFRPHQLPDETEKLLHEKQVAGRAAWIRLFDETMSSLRFPYGGKELIESEILNHLSDPHEHVRRDAAHSLAKVLSKNARTFALITNTLAKDKEIEDRWRKFPTPVSRRNLENRVEDAVVNALVHAVKSSYPHLSHRYYAWKAGAMGKPQLEFWDRNAPLPDHEEKRITWTEARDTVIAAYARFSGDMAETGSKFFSSAWVDAKPRPGKASGAFSHPTVPSAHPYILLNYQGKTRDVMTLAHELGHGVHQLLAAPQGHLLADTPLTLAETASVFGEMLTFQALLEREKDKKRRRALLAGKIEDMLNTVVRQIAMFEFERRVHDERKQGELTADRLGEIWLFTQREALGPAVKTDGGYEVFWTYIPHFIHAPFYVYAYAFGDCLVNSLYAVYEDAAGGFAEKYLDMLKSGGAKRHKALLAPFGLDASDPAFWHKGLGVVARFIDELEALG